MEERNQRPQEGSKIPDIAVGVLILIIIGMLYAGREYLADDTKSEDLTKVKIDSSAIAGDDSPSDPVTSTTATVGFPTASQPSVDTTTTKPKQTASTAVPKPVEEKKPEVKPTETPKIPTGGTTYSHKVDMGETFYGLANRYNMKWETLKAMNPDIQDVSKDVKVGVTQLKIRVKAVHTVGPGDVLRVVAQKYGISKALLMQANGRTKDFAKRGETLIIPFPEKQ